MFLTKIIVFIYIKNITSYLYTRHSNKRLSLYLMCSTPILLLPGFGGSLLKYKNKIIYPPTITDIIFNKKEWINIMMVNNNVIKDEYTYNNEIKTLLFGNKNALDLKTNIPFFDKKNIYKKLINENTNIYPIPYDFRIIHIPKYIDIFFEELTKYIEGFNKTISLLTHSSGGIIAHYFLTKKTTEWKKKHIKEIVYINVPFCGLTMPLIEITKNTYVNRILSRDLLKSFGGIILNLPNKKYIKPILLVNGIETNYINYFNLTDIEKIIKNNENFKKSFNIPNNVSTKVIYTSVKKTPAIINIKNNNYNIILGNGDGVVLLESILHPTIWKQKIEYIHIPLYEHSNILYSEELQNIIKNL